MNKHTVAILAFVVIGGVLVFIAYEYLTRPPLVISAFDPTSGDGTFQFGSQSGTMGSGPVDAGWGWSVAFVASTDTGWTARITRGGDLYEIIPVTGTGTF